MYVCMYVCMHVCMYVCMYACMYVGRLDSSVPRSKRLLTDDRSNVLIYMTGRTLFTVYVVMLGIKYGFRPSVDFVAQIANPRSASMKLEEKTFAIQWKMRIFQIGFLDPKELTVAMYNRVKSVKNVD